MVLNSRYPEVRQGGSFYTMETQNMLMNAVTFGLNNACQRLPEVRLHTGPSAEPVFCQLSYFLFRFAR